MVAGIFPRANGDTPEAKDVNKAGYRLFDAFEQLTLSVTDADANVAYSTSRDSHLIKNIGSNVCYLNFDATATTNSYVLNPQEFLILDSNLTAIHAICASTKTTTLRIIGQK